MAPRKIFTRRRVIGSLAVATATALVLVVCMLICFDMPPAAYRKVSELQAGMSRDDVVSILGKPDSIYDDGTELVYTRWCGWGILYVYLDEQGRFVQYEYDP